MNILDFVFILGIIAGVPIGMFLVKFTEELFERLRKK